MRWSRRDCKYEEAFPNARSCPEGSNELNVFGTVYSNPMAFRGRGRWGGILIVHDEFWLGVIITQESNGEETALVLRIIAQCLSYHVRESSV